MGQHERLSTFIVSNGFVKGKVDTTLFTMHVDRLMAQENSFIEEEALAQQRGSETSFIIVFIF